MTNGSKNKGGGQGRGSNNKRIRAGNNNFNPNQVKSYTREEWMALSEDQRSKVKALCAAKKAAAGAAAGGDNRPNAGGDGRSGGDNHSAASVTASSNVSSVTQDTFELQYEPAEPSTTTAAAPSASTTPRIRFVPVTKPLTKP